MRLASDARARLRAEDSLPGLLAAAFDAFEVIRALARASEDQVPGLFAAFMATAGAAVDGREALTVAPSLPPGPSNVPARSPAAASTVGEVTAALAGLAGLLSERLTGAAAQASTPGDHDACITAADAAERIRALMAGDGDGRFW